MRIAFTGATGFGLRCLEAVLAIPKCEVVGVLTLPETFAISYRPEGVKNVLHADFGPVARRYGLPVHVMTTAMSDVVVVEQFRKWKPDLILVVGWYHLVPKTIRDIAPVLGMHASLLPKYSGGAPLVWAIIKGEEKTGITLFMLDDGVDSGPIAAQAEEPIFEDDTIATLYARIEDRGIELLSRFLPDIASGRMQYRLQDESLRRVFPQRNPQDGLIDWKWPARRIYDFVRAQTRPYPGAFSTFKGGEIKIWRAAVSGSRKGGAVGLGLAGQILLLPPGDRLLVRCGDAEALALAEVEYGGSCMSGDEFVRRYVAMEQDAATPVFLGR